MRFFFLPKVELIAFWHGRFWSKARKLNSFWNVDTRIFKKKKVFSSFPRLICLLTLKMRETDAEKNTVATNDSKSIHSYPQSTYLCKFNLRYEYKFRLWKLKSNWQDNYWQKEIALQSLKYRMKFLIEVIAKCE